MKIKVEYSESIQITEGLWRKIGIEIEDADSDHREIALPKETAQVLHNQAKEYVQRWHKEGHEEFRQFQNQYAAGRSATDYHTGETFHTNEQVDKEFETLKAILAEYEFYEDAKEFLDTTDFKHTMEAKLIINNKRRKS